MKNIYMNGKITNIENIFDPVNPNRPDLWHTVSSSDTRRSIKTILNEWATNHNTYYYLHGVLTTFELK